MGQKIASKLDGSQTVRRGVRTALRTMQIFTLRTTANPLRTLCEPVRTVRTATAANRRSACLLRQADGSQARRRLAVRKSIDDRPGLSARPIGQPQFVTTPVGGATFERSSACGPGPHHFFACPG